MNGRSLRTAQRETAFLRLLARGHSVAQAAAAIGCQRRTVYDWRTSDDVFRLAWDDAVDQATEAIESVLYKKAKGGDLLACIFWLKSHKPSIYNRKQVVAIGGDPDAPPIAVEVDNVYFYMPANHRDAPEVLDETADLEGTVEDAA